MTTTDTSDRTSDPAKERQPVRDYSGLSEEDLAHQVVIAGDRWENLVDELRGCGVLPSLELADETVTFIATELPDAAAAHAELLRRWERSEVTRSRRVVTGRGIDGR